MYMQAVLYKLNKTKTKTGLSVGCKKIFRGPCQRYYMSLSFANMGHIGYINPTSFSQYSFICEIPCLFTFCPCSISAAESA